MYRAGKYIVVDDFYQNSALNVPGYASTSCLSSGPLPVGSVFADVTLDTQGPFTGTSVVTFAYHGAASADMAPVTNGLQIVHNPPDAAYTLRLWRAPQLGPRDNRPVNAGGDYIPPGVGILASNLTGRTLYLEGVNPSVGLGAETVSVNVMSSGNPGDTLIVK